MIKNLELVFFFSFFVLFFFLSKSLSTFCHHPLPFLSCFKDFLSNLRIMREYLVQVLFGQHKHITICLRPERERKEQVDFGQKKSLRV